MAYLSTFGRLSIAVTSNPVGYNNKSTAMSSTSVRAAASWSGACPFPANVHLGPNSFGKLTKLTYAHPQPPRTQPSLTLPSLFRTSGHPMRSREAYGVICRHERHTCIHTQGSALTLWRSSSTSGLCSACGRGWLRCSSGCGSRSCTRLCCQLGDGVLEVLGLAHEGDGPSIVSCRLALIRLLHARLL